jgi:hypothetical protein
MGPSFAYLEPSAKADRLESEAEAAAAKLMANRFALLSRTSGSDATP